MEKIKVVGYARVSTSSQDQLNSYENQHKYFKDVVNKNPEYELVNIYSDRGLTATSYNKREQFLKMLYDAGLDVKEDEYEVFNRKKKEIKIRESEREPLFQRILVKNTSRFTRNISSVEILRDLRRKGVYVDFLDINKSTEDEAGFVFIEMLIVFDENESRDKSRKVKEGHKQGAKVGVLMSNSRLYGYKRIDKYNLEIISEEAEVIQFIFNKYSEGLGFRAIEKALEKEGYKTREGKKFVKTTINRILANPIYTGEVVRNKYDSGTIFVDKRVTPKKIDESKWLRFDNRVPAIISKELFNRCTILKEGKINYKTNKGKYPGVSEYAGLIKCGKCGSVYHRNNDRGRVYYNCSKKKRDATCDNYNVSLIKLEESIKEFGEKGYYEMLKEDIYKYTHNLNLIQEKIKNSLENSQNKDQLIIKYEELDKLKIQQDKLTELYLEDKINKEYFDDKNSSILGRISALNREISIEHKDEDQKVNDIKEIDEIIVKLKALEFKKSYSKEEILKEIESIIIYSEDSRIVKFLDIKEKPPIVWFVVDTNKRVEELTKKYLQEK